MTLALRRMLLLSRLAETASLALDALALNDAELLCDVARWRRSIEAELEALW